jgi:hypothetical protein
VDGTIEAQKMAAPGDLLARLEKGKTGPKKIDRSARTNSPYREALEEAEVDERAAQRSAGTAGKEQGRW